MIRIAFSALSLLILSVSPGAARAAESYGNCAGTIASLPAVITTQGVWCMKGDLATASTSGSAITIAANNVTIDCNGFKLGGLAAGVGTAANGIVIDGSANATVRNCNIRGFRIGLHGETGAGGHLVEDNRFVANTLAGLVLWGHGTVIQRNQVIDTGGTTGNPSQVVGIWAIGDVDVIDNQVRGVVGDPDLGGYAIGIYLAAAHAAVVSGNRIGGLVKSESGVANGIRMDAAGGVVIRDNDIIGTGLETNAISCGTHAGGASNVVRDNAVTGFASVHALCQDDGGNSQSP